MKRFALLFGIVSVIAGCTGNTSLTTTDDPATVRSTLVARLQTLALKGSLFEPESVAPILGMHFRSESKPVPHLTADCGDGTGRWAEVTQVTESQPSWYRALPTGAGHVAIPAFAINPATSTQDPAIDYSIFHGVYCRDWPGMRDHREAHLWLTGLPAFTCLTPDEITALLPGVKNVWASDGVSLMELEGRTDDDSALTLTFSFRAGAACAISAELRQDQEAGYRYRRAQYKFEACRLPADKEFCATHSVTGWAGDSYRDMVINAYKRCGTVDAFYVIEPRTGVPALPFSRALGRMPCDGL